MKRSTAERVLVTSLVVAVVDCVYLSWRFLALHGDPRPWVVPHAGLCSWSERIDCDVVLVSPEARAFFVPNATLGLGFFVGAAFWWLVGARRYPRHRAQLATMLALWMGIASLITLRFWALLVRLPALCPFCPWNHLFTYVAFGAALVLARAERRAAPPSAPPSAAPTFRELVPHVARSIAPLFVLQATWWALVASGVISAGSTIVLGR